MSHDAAAVSPNSKLTAALAHAAAGMRVFPITPNVKKPPLITHWPDLATNDRRQIKTWWAEWPDANIGICTSSLCVVDVDVNKGGREAFEALIEEIKLLGEPFPSTWTARTATGGAHLYFTLPDGMAVPNSVGRIGTGLDVRGEGGYVVAPGSTIGGQAYEWKGKYSPGALSITEAPRWLIERCGKPTEKSELAGVRVVEENDIALARADEYLRRYAPEAVQGGRDDEAYKLAARLFDEGISYAECLARMLDWNETHCYPPLDHDVIEDKVRSGMKNRNKPIGAKHPDAPGFDAYETPEAPKSVAGSPTAGFFHPAKRFEAADLPLRPWIIPGFACRGRVTMLAGPGGVAKSTYTLMAAVATITQRDDICGFPVPVRQKVAVWNQEDDLEEMQRRLAAIMQTFNVSWADLEDADGKPMLYLNSGVDNPLMIALRSQEGVIRPSNKVAEAIAGIKAENIGLLILDPLVELHQAVENDNVQMRAVVSLVRDIAVQGECAVLLATHTKKPPAASSDGFAGEMDAARGASSQFGVIRVGATLFRASPKDAKTWRMEGTHLDYVRLDIAKNNLAARTGEPIWFKRAGVAVGGSLDVPGESVGVLKPIVLEKVRPTSTESVAELLAAALAGGAFKKGEWHPAAVVLKAAGFAGDNRSRNRAKFLDDAFDGNEQVETQVGRLIKKTPKAKSSVLLMLTPHLRTDEDADADENTDVLS